MKVGFIGLGNMGQPMASNLRAAGHELAVYNRTRQKAEALRPPTAWAVWPRGRGVLLYSSPIPLHPRQEKWMHVPRWLSVVLLGLLLLGGTGCAPNRQHLLEKSAAYVVYRLPSEQVLEAAREILKERGYIIMASTDPLYVRTDWRGKFDDSLDIGGVRERHFVMGKQLADGRFVLNAYRISYTTIGRTAPHPSSPSKSEVTGVQRMVKGDPLSNARPVLVRDLELEWQILSRVAPAVAHELESQVDQYLGTEPK